MNIFCFIPLMVWVLGVVWLWEYSNSWKINSGKWTKEDIEKDNKKNVDSVAAFWLWGIIFWFFIGIICLIG